MLSIVTDTGDIRTFELSPSVHVRIVDRDLRDEVGHYLDLVGSTRDQDARSMVISTNGTGERPLFVSYVSEVPIWKTTYRLVLAAKDKPLLQGWAIVDNTIGEDWQNVELSLVAGAPQSFIQHISQPYYGRRPVVSLPSAVQLAPQTHQATLVTGARTSRGRARQRALDEAGEATGAGGARRRSLPEASSEASSGAWRSSLPPPRRRPASRLRRMKEMVAVGVGRGARRPVRVPHQGTGDASEEPVGAGADRQQRDRDREGVAVEPGVAAAAGRCARCG